MMSPEELGGGALCSPMDVLRMGMTTPLRSFLGKLKPPALPQIAGGIGEEDQSPRTSIVTAAEIEGARQMILDAEVSSRRGGEVVARPGQSVVVVAFDGGVKELSHGGIVWAMENLLKRGDVLAVVSVFDSVRGPLGYRVKVGDRKWLGANQRLVEDEIEQRMEAWRSFPGLEHRCAEGGVKLVVTVKAAQRGEFAICREAVKLGAAHVVLDRSLKNRRREVYLQHLACDVTRMRRSGGVEVIRPGCSSSSSSSVVEQLASPTSVIPTAARISYGDQIDVFEISLGAPKAPRAFVSPRSSSSGSEIPYSGEMKPRPTKASPRSSSSGSEIPYSGEMKPRPTKASLRSSSSGSEIPYYGEITEPLPFFGESKERRRLSSPYERTMSFLTTSATHASAAATFAPTSSCSASSSHEDATANDHRDDDLFSIFHGSVRVADHAASGYESDDLFSIGNHSIRGPSPAPIPEQQSVVSEPLREATISRITFVVGLGEAVTLSLQEALRPGEGVLVGTSPSALFLLRSPGHGAELATGTAGSYIAMEGKMAMKHSFLAPGQRVLVVDALGRGRAVGVRRATVLAAPLVLLEALCEGRRWSAMLHHSESAAMCHHRLGMVPVKGLQLGDRVLLRLRSAEPSHAIFA